MPETSEPEVELPAASLQALLQRAGFKSSALEPVRWQRVSGGWNNRLYRLEMGDGALYALKAYFRSEHDLRPRLAQEWTLLNLAWQAGIRTIPEPLAHLPDVQWGLYGWIQGEAYTEVCRAEVQQALDFLVALQAAARRSKATLPKASEYCPDLQAHVLHLERRLQRLRQLPPSQGQVWKLVQTRILPLADKMLTHWRQQVVSEPDLQRPLAASERLYSPSDFGFHNALKTDAGAVFLDFEYAGWDDPAQLVCDFFAQFEVPVPEDHFVDFAQAVAALFPAPDWQWQRMQVLWPLHRLKWMCIALNHFLPQALQRRQYASDSGLSYDHQLAQFAKVQRLLQALEQS